MSHSHNIPNDGPHSHDITDPGHTHVFIPIAPDAVLKAKKIVEVKITDKKPEPSKTDAFDQALIRAISRNRF